MIEACESYCKQSYRNRCRILTSNGVEDLRVPIVHDGARLITDIKVNYATPWVRQSEYAIETAYLSSPFFEYYRDSFFEILDSAPVTLWELDMALTRYFCAKVGLDVNFEATSDFLPAAPCAGPAALGSGPTAPCAGPAALGSGPAAPCAGPAALGSGPAAPCAGLAALGSGPAAEADAFSGGDFRESVHPKRPSSFCPRPYWQVFREKFGFSGNLSIMDLLFNEGPESITYLR